MKREGNADGPVYWFVLLTKALEDSRLQDAADAQRELERLGYTVRWRRTGTTNKRSGKSISLRNPPRTMPCLKRQAEQLKRLPDGPGKLAVIHRLFVFCSGNDRFKRAFQDHLGEDLERLKAKWGLRSGAELLADQTAKNGGVV